MPLKSNRVGLVAPGKTVVVPLLEEPPLGHLQAVILKKILKLGRNAFGYKVLEELSDETGVWIDHSKVYGTIRALLDAKKKCIELDGERPSPVGGPPVKIYRVTPAGHAALKATLAHHEAVAEWLRR